MESDARKIRSKPSAEKDGSVLNVRKAVRFASKGKGGVALARESASSKKKTTKRK